MASISALRRLAERSTESPHDGDYQITARVGSAFFAKSKQGLFALLIPLPDRGSSVGRSGGGFTLRVANEVAFRHEGQYWTQAAAILECTENAVADTFLALVVDLSNRLSSTNAPITWRQLLAWMEEWQLLLSRRVLLAPEAQLGLWAELLVMLLGASTDALFAAWRGPEDDAVDFFLDGKGLEVKASRHRGTHHVSQSQAIRPRGDYPSYFLSMWVSSEPVGGVSLAEIVRALTDRLPDPSAFLKQLSRTGYSAQDEQQYMTRFTLLESPHWFDAEDIPRVRSADSGVSRLRYLATLDLDSAIHGALAQSLWHHFCGIEHCPTNLRERLA